MITFKDWLQQAESSASTRLRRDVALGLKPLAGMGSIHGHSTAAPWEVKAIKKKLKKKKKRKLDESAKNPVKHNEIDGWLKKVAELKQEIEALKKADKTAKTKVEPKEDDKEKEAEKPEDKSEKDEDEKEKEKEPDPKTPEKEEPKKSFSSFVAQKAKEVPPKAVKKELDPKQLTK